MKYYAFLFAVATIFLLITAPVEAIEHTVGLRSGMSYPLTDINENNDIHLMMGLSWDAWLKDYLSVGISPYFNKLSSEDSETIPGSYDSNVVGADIFAKLRPVTKGAFNFEDGFLRRISPFVNLGLGVAHYDNAGDKGKFAMVLPSAGLGLSFQTKWNVNFDLGVQAEHTLTDKFDNLVEKDIFLDSYLQPYLGVGYTFGKKKDTGDENEDKNLLRNKISMNRSFTHQEVQFDFDSDTLTPSAKAVLDKVADAMKKNTLVKFEIQGHTDNVGAESYNDDLSLRRAESVKKYMMEKGIAAERLQTIGYGSHRPIASNDTDEGRQMNRRIQFIIKK